ncbi:hypothetical protein [uncultured Paraglaciecola sp.]|uniref:hypothetical protein n=1 Tax=uncultured Paraglaciecola sp. TaxID=1765024 RepID=UPI00262B40A4|nr:hypothetical protein [uncultured Paraglaciecola sp.]
MTLPKVEFKDLNIDVEYEILGANFKFFDHKSNVYWGSCNISTGDAQHGVIKALMTPRLSFAKRRKLNIAIRRAMQLICYETSSYQRKKQGKLLNSRVE